MVSGTQCNIAWPSFLVDKVRNALFLIHPPIYLRQAEELQNITQEQNLKQDLVFIAVAHFIYNVYL